MENTRVKDMLVPVIIGGDILAYSYVREFNRAFGITSSVVLATKDIKMLSSSKLCDYRLVGCITEEDSLFAELSKIANELHTQNKKLLVLGCDDVHARLLSSLKPKLQKIGYTTFYVDFGLLDEITQKKRFYELCEELNIPYPKTWYVDCKEENSQLPMDEFNYPLIAKPSNSAQFQNAAIENKRKIYEIETPEELVCEYKKIKRSDYDNLLVIQEFVPGDDDAIYSLTTLSDENGDLIAVSGGRVCLQDHDPTALGNPLVILGDRRDEIIDCAARFLKKVGYHGFANFDIKYDCRDNTYKFFEINTRCGRNTYYMSLGGENFAELLVNEFVLNNTEHTEPRYAYRPFVYSCVPKPVIKKSIESSELKQTIADTRMSMRAFQKKQGLDPYPLFYKNDSFMHNFWAFVMYVNQIRKFKKFYWDTHGKQLKEEEYR